MAGWVAAAFKLFFDTVFGVITGIFKTDKPEVQKVVVAQQEIPVTDGKTNEQVCEELGLVVAPPPVDGVQPDTGAKG